VAKEEKLNFTVAAVQPEYEQADEKTQAAIDAAKNQGRGAW
jgi:hypothetical protein